MTTVQDPLPLPPEMTVREGRDLYLARNGFSTEAYTAPTFTLRIFGVPVSFSNPPSRQRAIPLHDLHHVATGYWTRYIGEAEIGAWELMGGCNSFILYYLNGMAALIGLFIDPRRVLRAFRQARGQRTLYRDAIAYEDLLGMTIGELRDRLGIPPEGLPVEN